MGFKRIEDMEAHFWQRVDKSGGPDACWPWLGYCEPSGYGRATRIKRIGATSIAHRIAYGLTHGPAPRGLLVRHRCDNKRCCNPAHLVLGTHHDNMQDALERGRLSSYMTDDMVRQARILRKTTNLTWAQIAESMGLDRIWGMEVVANAGRGHTFQNCEEPPAPPRGALRDVEAV